MPASASKPAKHCVGARFSRPHLIFNSQYRPLFFSASAPGAAVRCYLCRVQSALSKGLLRTRMTFSLIFVGWSNSESGDQSHMCGERCDRVEVAVM